MLAVDMHSPQKDSASNLNIIATNGNTPNDGFQGGSSTTNNTLTIQNLQQHGEPHSISAGNMPIQSLSHFPPTPTNGVRSVSDALGGGRPSPKIDDDIIQFRTCDSPTSSLIDDRPKPQTKFTSDYKSVEYDKKNESQNDARSAILVVAILISTATYQAVLSPPGGLWQENAVETFNNNGNSNVVDKPHIAGKAVMATRNEVGYAIFLVFNSLGFSVSLLLIALLIGKFPFRYFLIVAMFALLATYDICMVLISPRTTFLIIFNAISIALPFVISLGFMAAWKFLRWQRDRKEKRKTDKEFSA